MKSRAPSLASPCSSAAIAVWLAVGLLCGVTASAQSITGNIATPSGVPIAGVTVTATQSTLSYSDVTDAAGNYTISERFGGLDGTFTVTPTKTGYTFNPASSNVTLRFGFGNATANFTTPATVPSVTTQPAQNITPTTATLPALVNPNGSDTYVRFGYGLTTSYGQSGLKFVGGGTV